MLIYLSIFYVGAVLSLNIPKHNHGDHSSGLDSDGEPSSGGDLSLEYGVVDPSNNSSDLSHTPLITEDSPSSSTESAEGSEDETGSSFSSQSSGSYVNFSSFSIEDVSASSASERPIESFEEWSFDSSKQLLNTSGLSSLESDFNNSLEAVPEDLNNLSTNISKDQEGSKSNHYSAFHFEVKFHPGMVTSNSKVDKSIDHALSGQKNQALQSNGIKYPRDIELKPFYTKIIQTNKYKQTKTVENNVEVPSEENISILELSKLKKSVKHRLNKRSNFDNLKENSFDVDNNVFQIEPDVVQKNVGRSSSPQCPSNQKFVKRLDRLDFDLQQPVWHTYTFDTGAFNREELRIVEVVAEKSLVVDRPVVEWASVGGHAAGRGHRGLTLLSSHPGGTHINHLDFNEQITSMCMFQWWNTEERATNTGLVTAQDTIVNWHHLEGNNHLTQVWSWALYDSVKHLSIYKLQGQWKIAITSFEDVVSIFGLDLWKEWWFEQRWSGNGKPIIINEGKFIAVIQSDLKTVAIFKFNPFTRLYNSFKNITSPGVLEVCAFTAGSYSFLAVGGDRSAIYQIKGDLFEEKVLQNYLLDHVELWLPIKLGYYRNDVMLLFQHRLDHHSHSSSVLEALQWNGHAFVLLEHSPCISHSEEMFGFTCILDAEGEKGLRGAAILSTASGEAGVLTASEDFAPIMFLIKTELVKRVDPLEQQVKDVLAAKQLLRDKLLAQQEVLEDALRVLNHRDKDLVRADNWKIKELHAPVIRVNGQLKDFLRESSVVSIGGQNVKNLDFNIDMSPLFRQIKDNHLRIKALVRKIGNAVLKKEGLPTTLHNVKINGGITVKGNIQVNNAQINILNGLSVNEVFKDSIMKPQDKNIFIHGKKIVKNLITNHFNVETINGIDVINPTKNVDPLFMDGDLELTSHLNVLADVKLGDQGILNGINLKNDIYRADTKWDEHTSSYPLKFDSIKVEEKFTITDKVNGYDFTAAGLNKAIEEISNQALGQVTQNADALNLKLLNVEKNLNFDFINGRPWKDFIDRVIMKSQDTDIEQLRVDGKIVVDKSLTMNILNSLQFPQDYFLSNETSASTVSATKTFTAPIRVDSVDCDGTVNGIRPQDIVTLSSPQNLNNFTFYDLTVTERLDVKGEITGRDLDVFLSNPLLRDTTNIKSNVIFKNLVVEGNVIVQNKINDTNWETISRDIVEKSTKPLTINSLKTFEGNVVVENGLNILSGFINDRRIKEFFTIDTEQDVVTDELSGDIIFDSVQVGGLFDGVNMSDLIDNTLKLSGDQTIIADLLFEDEADDPDNVIIEDRAMNVVANRLEVTEACNNWMVSDAFYIENENNLILNAPEFDKLFIDQLIIDGNLDTSFSISGVYLEEFDKVRLSKTQDREITAPYKIVEARMQNLNLKYMNGQTNEDISTFVRQLNNIHEEIAAGKVIIRNLHVTGQLDISRLNGIDLHQLAEDAVWLKEDSYISKPIKFIDNIRVGELLLAGNVCNKHFENFIQDIVQTTEDSTIFTGKKTYMDGLEVRGNVATDYINSIMVQNLLNIKVEQTLEGTAYINGNLKIYGNIQTNGMVNDVSMRKLSDFVKYARNNEYHLEGNVSMSDGTFIDHFIVNGLVNELYNPGYILNSVVNLHDDNVFENRVIFNGSVIIRNNLDITDVCNGVDVADLINNIIFLNEDTLINSSIQFREPLTVLRTLDIYNNLQANIIKGCSIEDWERNAVFLNQWQKVTGRKNFHDLTIKNNVDAEYINNYAVNDLIKVREDVDNKSVKFERVFVDSDLTVYGTINSINLDIETKNRLMRNGKQVIEAPTYFHSNVHIMNNANVKMVNNKNLDLTMVDSDTTLRGNYIFHGKTTFVNNLNISGPINGRDLNEDVWMRNSVFLKNNGEAVSENVLINNLPVQEVILQFRNMCAQLNNVADIVNRQVTMFKELKEVQNISISEEFSAYHFEHNEDSFLIFSKLGFCTSELWKWNKDLRIFTEESQIATGCAVSWQAIKQETEICLISLSSELCECNYTGLELWNFDGYTLQHISSLAPAQLVLALPNEEGTVFYLNRDNLYKYQVIPPIQQEARLVGHAPMRFFPYSSNGLMLTDGQGIYRLLGVNELQSPPGDFKVSIAFKEEKLAHADEVVDFTAGRRKKKLVAAVWSDIPNNVTDGSITIYKDLFEAKIFQKLTAVKPSSLTVIQLSNYQTILLFVENHQAIRIYSYRGFQGFKFWSSLDIQAKKIQVFRPTPGYESCIIINSDTSSSVHCVNLSSPINILDHFPCNL